MTKQTLIEDKERMDEITDKLGKGREDIWQDRYVYWIADAVAHILEWMDTRKREEERNAKR